MVKSSIVLILFLISGTGLSLFSQQLSNQVLVTVAGVTNSGSISYSQTIGETAVELFSSSDYIFTQGFQQPCISLVPTDLPDGNGVDVYPNPATDNVTIKLFGDVSREFRIELITITGTVVITEKVSCLDKYYLKKIIPVGFLTKGLYFIRVLSTDNSINRTFRIDKM